MPLNRAASMMIAGLLYACGIAVISLSPFTDWRWIPESPLAFLSLPWPRYWTGFDVLVNVVAYAPFGVLIGRSVSYRLRHLTLGAAWALIITVLVGIGLSVLLESLQTYLPSRRPSLLDVVANGFGTFLGAFLASAYAQNKSRIQISETRPVEIGGLMLLGLWLLAQAAPQQIWLALGDIGMQADLRPTLTWFSPPAPNNPAVLAEMFAAQRILAEALCVASGLIGCALMMHLTLLESSRWFSGYTPGHWVRTLVIVMALTLTVRAAWVFLLSPSGLSSWFTAGTQAGVILAALSAYGLAGARPTQQRVVAIAGLLVTIVLANSLPSSDYASGGALEWSQGRWLNLQELANLAASGWPFAALVWLAFALPRKSLRAVERGFGLHRGPTGPR